MRPVAKQQTSRGAQTKRGSRSSENLLRKPRLGSGSLSWSDSLPDVGCEPFSSSSIVLHCAELCSVIMKRSKRKKKEKKIVMRGNQCREGAMYVIISDDYSVEDIYG